MQSFFEWFQASGQDSSKPWLILGKGPSFEKRAQFDLGRFQIVSLNHAVREQPVLMAHVIDLDVVHTCAEAIERNAKFIVMPWYPHVGNRPGPMHLGALVEQDATISRLDKQGKLLWYNHCLAPSRNGNSPLIGVRFFSSEAVLNLLATAGVQTVRSLGIDGGTTYSQHFQDLTDRTLLANGWDTFDRQFSEIAKILLKTNLDYAPLDVESPIRVYVAATEAQMLAVRILEFSIRKWTSMSVSVQPLYQTEIEIPTPRALEKRARTPFSFQRFLIPALTKYKGRALYLDSDMQVFQDLRPLWNTPFEGADLLTVREPKETGRRPQFSVMLLNCDQLKWDIRAIVEALDEDRLTYEELLYEMAVAPSIRAELDAAWNCLERYDPQYTALLHYTDMNTQPWLSQNNPLGYLWFRDLFEAVDSKFVDVAYLQDHVQRGFIRPSLLYQLEHRIEDSRILPRKARQLDDSFVPPFRTSPLQRSKPWTRSSAYFRAVLLQGLRHTHLCRLKRHLQHFFKAAPK